MVLGVQARESPERAGRILVKEEGRWLYAYADTLKPVPSVSLTDDERIGAWNCGKGSPSVPSRDARELLGCPDSAIAIKSLASAASTEPSAGENGPQQRPSGEVTVGSTQPAGSIPPSGKTNPESCVFPGVRSLPTSGVIPGERKHRR